MLACRPADPSTADPLQNRRRALWLGDSHLHQAAGPAGGVGGALPAALQRLGRTYRHRCCLSRTVNNELNSSCCDDCKASRHRTFKPMSLHHTLQACALLSCAAAVVTSAAWRQLKAVSAQEGLVAAAYERRHGAHSRVLQVAKLYCFGASSGGLWRAGRAGVGRAHSVASVVRVGRAGSLLPMCTLTPLPAMTRRPVQLPARHDGRRRPPLRAAAGWGAPARTGPSELPGALQLLPAAAARGGTAGCIQPSDQQGP